MSKRTSRLAGALALAVFAGAAQAAPWVRVTTGMGEFIIELNSERAPLTVANFLRYVKQGHYSGTVFHRVIGSFVVQGGGYTMGDYRLKPVHEPVVNEAGSGLQNKRGTVGLARAAEAHSGNAQFYINLADNPDLDPVPTRWGYAVFGKVVQGMEVVERIGVLPTGKMGPFKSEAPLTPVAIEKIELMSAPPQIQMPPRVMPLPEEAEPPADTETPSPPPAQ